MVTDPKALVTSFFAAVNAREAFHELLTEDFLATEGDSGRMSRDQLKGIVAYLFSAFPDLRYTVVDQITEGDRVAVRLLMEGTHKGDYQGHAGTGKTFAVDEVELMQVRDGKIAGYHIVWDEAGFKRQLGIG